jgi:hypothetical protein
MDFEAVGELEVCNRLSFGMKFLTTSGLLQIYGSLLQALQA